MRPARWIDLHKKIRYLVYGKPTHTRGSTSNDSPHGKGTGSALPEILLLKRVEPLVDSGSLRGNHLPDKPSRPRNGGVHNYPSVALSRCFRHGTMLYRKTMNSIRAIRFLECLHRGRASSFVTANQHRYVVLVP